METSHAEPLIPIMLRMGGVLREMLTPCFTPKELAKIFFEAERFFQESIPEMPDLGADNPWLKSILGVAYLSGIWLELEKRHWGISRMSVVTQMALGEFVSGGHHTGKLRSRPRQRLLFGIGTKYCRTFTATGVCRRLDLRLRSTDAG